MVLLAPSPTPGCGPKKKAKWLGLVPVERQVLKLRLVSTCARGSARGQAPLETSQATSGASKRQKRINYLQECINRETM